MAFFHSELGQSGAQTENGQIASAGLIPARQGNAP